MSHEMRTPLHGILGLARMLSGNEHDVAKAHQLGLIHKSGDHLLSVINDVLDFSRMESSGLPIHKQAFDLHAVVREVAEILRIGAEEKHLTLTVKFDAETDKDVIGDAVRIRQVLNNLVGNAIKFTQEGGVCVQVTRLGFTDDIAIAVQDTGIGIPANEIAKVFDPFHQAEGTYQRRFGGTGLGLTISRELCRAMGGDLQCSSGLGKGSEFRSVLPLQAVARAAPPPAAATQASARAHERANTDHAFAQPKPEAPPHVLVVDDNPVNVLVAQAQLQQLGATVTVMSDGQEAVDWLSRNRPDLVLMDCEMPGLDGFEATHRIREQERTAGREPVGIVAITANGGEVYGDRCVNAGMNGHLAKPFRPEDLALVLKQHLKGGFTLFGRAAAMQSENA
jgi:CheY-like chemotaxis protein